MFARLATRPWPHVAALSLDNLLPPRAGNACLALAASGAAAFPALRKLDILVTAWCGARAQRGDAAALGAASFTLSLSRAVPCTCKAAARKV